MGPWAEVWGPQEQDGGCLPFLPPGATTPGATSPVGPGGGGRKPPLNHVPSAPSKGYGPGPAHRVVTLDSGLQQAQAQGRTCPAPGRPGPCSRPAGNRVPSPQHTRSRGALPQQHRGCHSDHRGRGKPTGCVMQQGAPPPPSPPPPGFLPPRRQHLQDQQPPDQPPAPTARQKSGAWAQSPPPPGPAPPEAARPTRASLSPQSPPAQPASPKACPPRRGAQHSTLRAPNLGATGRGLCRGEGGGRRDPAQPQAGGSAGARGDPRPRLWPKCGEAVSLGVHSASDSGGRGLPAPWATSPLPGVPLRAGGALP